ncbi:MAG: hypothetical protein PWR23_1615 [Peptostreptococcaceae bacterium]|jgi:glycosyltransferase involved in cell wall biosynthesis|nr:hypothetical protein [Peptostreptococcaceae bacterium]
MKISACIITKNEEKNIRKCINSFIDIVDEVIVVDTGSNDKTVELSKELGAMIYNFEWNNDFAEARNYALSKVKGDWIVFLDADEYFEEKSVEKIPKIISDVDKTKYNAIGCKIINIDSNKDKKIQGSFLNIRIFKNDKNIRYIGNIHERLNNPKGKINIASYYNDITIYHTGYSTDINKLKAQRNLDILLKNIENDGYKEEYYHYLSDCYLTLGEYEKAIKYSRLQINSGKELLGNNTKNYVNIIQSLIYLKAPKKEIEKEIKVAINHFSDHPNFYLSYADFLMGEKRYTESLENFLKFFKVKEEYRGIEADHTEGFMDIAYAKTGFIYQMKNDEVNAILFYIKSLRKNKYDSGTFQSLIYLIKNFNLDEAINLINEIYDISSEEDMQFIVYELIKVKNRDMLGYYTNIWYKKLGKQDMSLLITLLLNGRYQTCFNIFYEAYIKDFNNEYSLYTIISAILSNKKENIYLIKNHVKPSYRRIINAWENEQEKQLFKTDIEDYIGIFKELISIGDIVILNKFIDLKNLFLKEDKPMLIYRMAKTLQDFYIHDLAITLYNEYILLLQENISSISSVNMALGYCCYKLKHYKLACNYFMKALENGYIENDIKEFLNWTKDQTEDDNIKKIAENLINQATEVNLQKDNG